MMLLCCAQPPTNAEVVEVQASEQEPDNQPAIVEAPPQAAEKKIEPQESNAEKPPEEVLPAYEETKVEPAPKGASVSIEFVAGSETKVLEFTEGPLGIVFNATVMPLTVTGLAGNGVGDKAGVQVGWVFAKIGGESLEGLDYPAAMALLQKVVGPLPKLPAQEFAAGACVFEFTDENSRVWKVGFTKTPFGVSLDNQMPIKVKSLTAGGEAEMQGVKPGWTFTSIAGEKLKGKDYKTILNTIKEKSKDMPSGAFA